MKNATLKNMSKKNLSDAYVDLIGYDPFLDEPTISETEIRQTLQEYAESLDLAPSDRIYARKVLGLN